jgi:hypothetical protein
VRGIAERERLGIFHIDTGNRWTPGDLENSSGWKPRVPTELDVQDGRLTGVRYDGATAELAYDGSGKGSETASRATRRALARCRVRAFRIRVLEPTIAWGDGRRDAIPGHRSRLGAGPVERDATRLKERRHR